MSFNYTVEKPSGATYGFSLNANSYYESTNKGVNSSYAMAKLNFTTDGSYKLYLDCINYAETNYDFGILSELDKTLQMSDNVDSTNVKRSFKGSSSANVQTVDYGQIAQGSHYIYIKFRKDSSASSNKDSLQFKVRTEQTMPVLESPTISLNGDILTITPVTHATSYKVFSNNTLLTTSTTTTVNLSNLFSKGGAYTITVTALASGYLESGPSNAVIYKLQLVTLDLTTLNLSQGTHAIKVKAKGEGYGDSAFSNEVSYTVLPQLEAPTISLNGDLLSSSTVQHATSYAIYSNNALLTTITTTSVDLSTLITTGGTYTIYVIAKAANYQDSPHSNEVSYTVEQAMPVKGDLINLDMTGSGTTSQYRVLKVNGTIVEVLGMTDLTTMDYHIPISSQTGSFDGGTTGLLYNSSDLDTYLNTTWYNTLSSTAKSALVVKNIIQKMYNFTKNVDSTATYTGIMSDNTNYMLVYKDQKNVGNRNIYTLGVEDVVDYTGNGVDNLNATNIWQMFWNSSTSQAGKFIWLNSAYSEDSANAFFVFGAYGFLRNNILDSASVRPAFTIDLSKITWLKV